MIDRTRGPGRRAEEATRNRVREQTRPDEAGTSLVEMLVTSLILAILSATVLGIVLTLMDTSNASTHRFQNLADAQPVMDVVTSSIRAATSVSAAQPQTMTFQSALGRAGGDTQITLTLVPPALGAKTGTLTQTSQQPPSLVNGTRTLSSQITYPGAGATPLFTYYDLTNTVLSVAAAQANPSEVASVSINLVDNDAPNIPASASTLTAKVWLLNAVYENS